MIKTKEPFLCFLL